jgi:ABC-2 type transport system permease protein
VLGAIAVLVTLIVGAALGTTAPLGNLIAAGVLAWLSSLMLTSLDSPSATLFPRRTPCATSARSCRS